MRDLIEMANTIDKSLSDRERREKFCDLLLEEFRTLKGKDLAPYLSEFVFDMVQPGTRITLKFPIGTHVINSKSGDIKRNDSVGIVENITQETIDCLVQHIKAFHEQDACKKTADFGEPCATCKHVKECGFDWLAKMKPVLNKSDVTIQICYSGHLHKRDNCSD